MKVALIGISGRVGSRLADELVRRDHAVTGIARNIASLAPRHGTEFKQADATDAA